MSDLLAAEGSDRALLLGIQKEQTRCRRAIVTVALGVLFVSLIADSRLDEIDVLRSEVQAQASKRECDVAIPMLRPMRAKAKPDDTRQSVSRSDDLAGTSILATFITPQERAELATFRELDPGSKV